MFRQQDTPPGRLVSLDLLKGALTFKIALAHLAFFVAVPALAHAVSIGRSIAFPALLFVFGIGSSLSQRRKPAWPLFVLLGTLVFGSLVRESYLDYRIAHGYGTLQHPLPGEVGSRLIQFATFSHAGHYADFLQVYVLMLGLSLLADRAGRPLRSWNPFLLAGSALGLHLLGLTLQRTGISGPLSAFWNDGFRSFQYAPLFAAGILVGAHGKGLLQARHKNAVSAAEWLAVKLVALKLVLDAFDWVRRGLGDAGHLWKHGGIESNVGGILVGLLASSIASDLAVLAQGRVSDALQEAGRRTIVSLCLQVFLLPLAGVVALQISSSAGRIAFGLTCWALFVAVVLHWRDLTSLLVRPRTVLHRKEARELAA